MRNKLYLNSYGRKGQLGEVFIGHGKDVCHHLNSCEINSLAELISVKDSDNLKQNF